MISQQDGLSDNLKDLPDESMDYPAQEEAMDETQHQDYEEKKARAVNNLRH